MAGEGYPSGPVLTAAQILAALATVAGAFGYNVLTKPTISAGGMIYGGAANAVSELAIGGANTVLTSSGTAPQWSTSLNLAGTLAVTGATTLKGMLSLSAAGTAPAALLHIVNEPLSAGFWGQAGIQLRIGGSSLTDTSSAGSVAAIAANVIGAPTFNTTNAGVTYAEAATLFIGGPPNSGTNAPTFTTVYAVNVSSGALRLGGTIASTTIATGTLILNGAGAGIGCAGAINAGGSIFARSASPSVVSGDGTGAPNMTLNGAAANARTIVFQTNAVGRWDVRCDASAETGADAGATLQVVARTDAGSASLGVVWQIARAANGAITHSRPTVIAPAAVASGTQTALAVTGAANTALTLSTEVIDVNFNLARTVQWATGAIATQRAAVFQAPTYAFVGGSTITTAATLAVTGAPVAGTNATITTSLAFWTQAGAVQHDQGTINAAAINLPLLNLTATWNLAAAITGIKFNVTDTSSNAGSLFADYQIGGTSRHNWAKEGAYTQVASDATTNVVTAYRTLGHNSTGTPAAGFGTSYRWQLQSSTTAAQNAGLYSYEWVVATHGSRTARGKFYASDSAADRECIRIEASGTAAMVGFLGANAVVQQALTVDPVTVLVNFGFMATGGGLVKTWRKVITGINVNSAATDVGTFTNLPAKYRVIRLEAFDASTSLTTATVDLRTATAGAGTALVAAAGMAACTAATKFSDLTLAAIATTDYQTTATLTVRNVTAQGGAATVSFLLEVIDLT